MESVNLLGMFLREVAASIFSCVGSIEKPEPTNREWGLVDTIAEGTLGTVR